jgi:hypothetical protein
MKGRFSPVIFLNEGFLNFEEPFLSNEGELNSNEEVF